MLVAKPSAWQQQLSQPQQQHAREPKLQATAAAGDLGTLQQSLAESRRRMQQLAGGTEVGVPVPGLGSGTLGAAAPSATATERRGSSSQPTAVAAMGGAGGFGEQQQRGEAPLPRQQPQHLGGMQEEATSEEEEADAEEPPPLRRWQQRKRRARQPRLPKDEFKVVRRIYEYLARRPQGVPWSKLLTFVK